VSAFANQFGGWLFYGIAEAADGGRTAGSFPGISAVEAAASEPLVRDAVRGGMNPAAYFETRILRGPCVDIGLPADRAVLVVRIPEGPNTPYVHGSGRIYRRIADASDPREATDRHTLDTLFERSRERRQRLVRFLKTSVELSEDEGEQPYASIFLLPDPLGDRGIASRATFKEFAELMQQPPPIGTAGLVFDNIFTSARGFVARQVGTNDPHHKVLTWEYHLDGSSVVTLPLRRGLPSGPRLYAQQSQFMEICHPSQLSRVLDINVLLNVIAACIATHWKLSRAFGVPLQVWAKLRLENVWRLVPFLDTSGFSSFTQRFGIPTVQQSEVLVPPGTSFEELLPLDARSGTDDELSALAPALTVANELFYALGLPISMVATDPKEFLEAGARGGEVAGGRWNQ